MMDRAVTCGGWLRFRVPQVSAASAPERLILGVPGTHVPMVDTAEKAGTVTFVTAMVLATSVAAVRRVRISEKDGSRWGG